MRGGLGGIENKLLTIGRASWNEKCLHRASQQEPQLGRG